MIKQFLIWISGADIKLVKKVPQDEPVFLGIGLAILTTAIFAAISGTYALNSVFDNLLISLILGVLWGGVIFNIDRLLVVSLDKYSSLRTSFWKRVLIALPRGLLAVVIALVISKPLEIKIFEDEIKVELESIKNQMKIEIEDEVSELYIKKIEVIEQQLAKNEKQIIDKTSQITDMRDELIKEVEGRSITGLKGYGVAAREKDRWVKEYQADIDQLEEQKDSYMSDLVKLKKDKDSDEIFRKEKIEDFEGMLANLTALGSLSKKNWFIINAVTFLFIFLEIAPIIAKFFSRTKSYDILLENVVNNHQLKIKDDEANKKRENEIRETQIQSIAKIEKIKGDIQKKVLDSKAKNIESLLKNEESLKNELIEEVIDARKKKSYLALKSWLSDSDTNFEMKYSDLLIYLKEYLGFDFIEGNVSLKEVEYENENDYLNSVLNKVNFFDKRLNHSDTLNGNGKFDNLDFLNLAYELERKTNKKEVLVPVIKKELLDGKLENALLYSSLLVTSTEKSNLYKNLVNIQRDYVSLKINPDKENMEQEIILKDKILNLLDTITLTKNCLFVSSMITENEINQHKQKLLDSSIVLQYSNNLYSYSKQDFLIFDLVDYHKYSEKISELRQIDIPILFLRNNKQEKLDLPRWIKNRIIIDYSNSDLSKIIEFIINWKVVFVND